ncbi:MAG: MarR family transcriptional regulator [Fusobacteriaceae bacterium]|nr:MarR family transcriptional regulator [Fusobacteriaceae bacterium]
MSKLDNALCFKIYSSARILNRLYQPILEKLNLTYPQYVVMMALWDKDKISFKELRKTLMLETGTLTPIIKKLEVMDLLKRVKNTDDERNIFIELTTKGREMENESSKVSESILKKIGISKDKYDEFLEETQELFNTLNAAEDRY